MADEQQTEASEAQGEKININRREFLNLAWLASLGILSIDLGVVTYFFALPRFREGEFGGVFTLGTPNDVPEAGSAPQDRPDGKFWLSHTEDGVLALYKVCTHLGCLYGWIDEEGIFRCPCHGSQFQPDGTYIFGPAPRSLDRFVVQLVDKTTGEVVAMTDPESGGPVPLPEDANITIQVDTGTLLRGKPK